MNFSWTCVWIAEIQCNHQFEQVYSFFNNKTQNWNKLQVTGEYLEHLLHNWGIEVQREYSSKKKQM